MNLEIKITPPKTREEALELIDRIAMQLFKGHSAHLRLFMIEDDERRRKLGWGDAHDNVEAQMALTALYMYVFNQKPPEPV